MRIALFGAGGLVGSRVAPEAVARGHRITAIARELRPAPPGADAVGPAR